MAASMSAASNSNNNSKPSSHTSTKPKGPTGPTSRSSQHQLDGTSKASVASSKNDAHHDTTQPGLAGITTKQKLGSMLIPYNPNPNPYHFQSMASVSGQSRSKSLKSIHISSMSRYVAKSHTGLNRGFSFRAHIERAIKDRKIYTLIGVFPGIRRALNRRGWVEKTTSMGAIRFLNYSLADLENHGYQDESDQAYLHRVLRDYPPDFIWVYKRDSVNFHTLLANQIVNRHPKAIFTSKVGITSCLQNLHWFCENGVANTFFPRCYRLCINEEKNAFVNDYRLTACLSLLKWVVGAYERDGDLGVMDVNSTNGRVPSICVDFAIRQVNNYVRLRRHEDIDWLVQPTNLGLNWDLFLSQYYCVVLLKMKLSPVDTNDTSKSKYDSSLRALQRVAPFWPQLNIDGTNNVWICKPGARSRGSGIVLMNNLDKILSLLGQSGARESNWVVQKYIERPLLIYQTKFDIRQWFIVSDWSPLTVWFYKESYIRFCTKPFSIDDFHESIHLCNNAVQSRYQNSDKRDAALPAENMWDNYTFQAYLKSIGKMDLWDTIIYPGMKQGILGALLASQEQADYRKNCFELYGADFMLSDDFVPWLIEINSSPCMASTTSVTARMCGRCLEDCMKVVVDRRDNKRAETGMFELIYKQNESNMPFHGHPQVQDAGVHVRKLTRDVDWPSIMTKYNNKRVVRSSVPSRILRTVNFPSSTTISNGMTFTDLIQRLRLKDAQKKSPLCTAPETATESIVSVPSAQNSGTTGSLLKTTVVTNEDTVSLGQTRILRRRRKSQNKGRNQSSERGKSKESESIATTRRRRKSKDATRATVVSTRPHENDVSPEESSLHGNESLNRRSLSADRIVELGASSYANGSSPEHLTSADTTSGNDQPSPLSDA